MFWKKNQLVTKKEAYDLTQQVKVADVKQYLMDEYDRAFVRENTINILENEVKNLTKIKIKYDALLVISDKNRERLLNCEKQIENLKVNKKILKDENEVLKNYNNNIELNYKKHLGNLNIENKKLLSENALLNKKIEKLNKSIGRVKSK